GGAGNIPPLRVLREQYKAIDDYAIKYPEVWKHAVRIEGSNKALSKHAGGVVITDNPITDYMPLMRGANDNIITSWSDRADAPIISEHGLLKADILSLTGLTKQGETIRLIEEHYGEHIDLDELPVAKDPYAVDP